MKQVFVAVSLLCLLGLSCAAVYPVYSTCYYQWAEETLGLGPFTICESVSLSSMVSSMSSFLAGQDQTLNGQISNPFSFNIWLQNHNGYGKYQDLNNSYIEAIGFTFLSTNSNLSDTFDKFQNVDDTPVFLEINAEFWVLYLSTNGDNLNVVDPIYGESSYPKSAVTASTLYFYAPKAPIFDADDLLNKTP